MPTPSPLLSSALRWGLSAALAMSAACSDGTDSSPATSASDAASATDGGGSVADATADGGGADTGADASSAGEKPYTAKLNLPKTPFKYANQPLPAHFKKETLGFHGQTALVNDDTTPADNPITDAGATLGRVLFYDKNLSKNRTVACASCHKAELGFSDDKVLSDGFDGGKTKRHSMGLTQARYYRSKHFFWDQRAKTLEDQVLMPFQDPVEMGMTLALLQARVTAGDYYPALFKAAFGDSQVTANRISRALAQFVRSLVSTNSKYDQGRAKVSKRSDPFPNFDDWENLGKKLFVMPPPMGGKGCFICHGGEGFVAVEGASNGLDADVSADLGYGEVTGKQSDNGRFKVPSLRNVALRAPYMHDGRFATLEAVLDHYATKVQPAPNLGPPFFVNNGKVNQLNLTGNDKKALIAFLKTLTDVEMTKDVRFSNPFVE